MSKRRRTPKREPLTVGDVFAMRLPDGRYGACRVVRRPGPRDEFADNTSAVVAATEYIGAAAPTIDDPALRRLLVLTHHSHDGRQACALWLSAPVPAGFERIGAIEPSRAEQRLVCNSFSHWSYFPLQVHVQWRWDHDRKALLADDAADERQERAKLEQRRRQKEEDLAKLTYASFRKRKLFKDWTTPTPARMITASRRLMKETAKKLESLGPAADHAATPAARAMLRDCILAFNQLDQANGYWIETEEREDICEHFYELAHLAGFDKEPNLADEWRDW